MKRDKLREKLIGLIPQEGKEPELRVWIADKNSDGEVRVSVNPQLEKEEFMLASDIIKYIEWLQTRDNN